MLAFDSDAQYIQGVKNRPIAIFARARDDGDITYSVKPAKFGYITRTQVPSVFNYIPNRDFVGSDTIKITATNDSGQSVVHTVDMVIINADTNWFGPGVIAPETEEAISEPAVEPTKVWTLDELFEEIRKLK